MRPEPPIEVSPNHPMFGIAAISHTPSTGIVEIEFTDGRRSQGDIGLITEADYIRHTIFDIATSTLRVNLLNGSDVTMKIGTVRTAVDHPVVYLDQNHWIDMARHAVGSPQLSPERRQVCKRIAELAEAGQIILPVSAAHLGEIAKKADRQRTEVAQVMLKLSQGWQMCSPLRVEDHELSQIFASGPALTKSQVFTVEPGAMWSSRTEQQLPAPSEQDPLPADLESLVGRLTWATAMVETFVDTRRLVSDAGLRKTDRWAASFQELAVHVRGNPKARQQLRLVTRVRFMSDINDELTAAAGAAGLTPEQFYQWSLTQSEHDLAAVPMLGRFRELVHLRVSNADDKWEGNDLNDTLYLCCASGYANIVVGEKKTVSYLLRMKGKVPDGAEVFRRLEDALPSIEAALE
ncbi:hypothetical protein [Actinoplanes sp. NPDC049802]|uniref:hypothetical protein n=1 Tax=Actinoplanes sp. NPDC049802 TaxID=3154742 RepID=UPI0033F0FDF5